MPTAECFRILSDKEGSESLDFSCQTAKMTTLAKVPPALGSQWRAPCCRQSHPHKVAKSGEGEGVSHHHTLLRFSSRLQIIADGWKGGSIIPLVTLLWNKGEVPAKGPEVLTNRSNQTRKQDDSGSRNGPDVTKETSIPLHPTRMVCRCATHVVMALLEWYHGMSSFLSNNHDD